MKRTFLLTIFASLIPLSSASAKPLVDCRQRVFQSPNSIRSLMGWSKRYQAALEQWSDPNSYPGRPCNEAIRLRGSAYCKAPNDPNIAAALRRSLQLCRVWNQRATIAARAKANHQPPPRGAYSPAQIAKLLRGGMRWVQMDLHSSKTVPRALGRLFKLLRLAPNNAKLVGLFDRLYAAYFGVTPQKADQLRRAGLANDPLARWSKAKLAQFAIDVLLGKPAHASPKRIGVSYLMLASLVDKVYEPVIKANAKEFRQANCAVWLRHKRRNYFAAAVAKALGTTCPRSFRTTLRKVLTTDPLRLRLIELIAKSLPDRQQVVSLAALTIAQQAGAKRTPMCWALADPVKPPQTPQVATGASACGVNRSGYRSGQDRYGRPLPFVMAYEATPMNTWTRLTIMEAMEFAKKAGPPASALIGQLARAMRKAKAYKCIAFTVTMAKTKLTHGWGKLHLYSVGSNKEISCRRLRRSRSFVRAMPANWTNFFDQVVGGKFTGRWQTYYRRYLLRHRIVRMPSIKKRPALIFVRRKI
ncbi:MAG: hypothetical protein J7M25_07455 [Deltaproteobacteria bacterium]|nr:hypothetical protein [Deltaproteobacteria bacterium]